MIIKKVTIGDKTKKQEVSELKKTLTNLSTKGKKDVPDFIAEYFPDLSKKNQEGLTIMFEALLALQQEQ